MGEIQSPLWAAEGADVLKTLVWPTIWPSDLELMAPLGTEPWGFEELGWLKAKPLSAMLRLGLAKASSETAEGPSVLKIMVGSMVP